MTDSPDRLIDSPTLFIRIILTDPCANITPAHSRSTVNINERFILSTDYTTNTV